MKNKKNEQQLETTYNFVELASIDQNSSRHILSRDMSEPMIFRSSPTKKIFSWSDKKREKSTLFSMGGPGSGVYFHSHSSTWRALAFGKTKWYLLPPGSYQGPLFGNMVTWLQNRRRRWWRRRRRRGPRRRREEEAEDAEEEEEEEEDAEEEEDLPVQPLEIVQQEGEILYIPDLWLHATINLQTSVGVAVEMGYYV